MSWTKYVQGGRIPIQNYKIYQLFDKRYKNTHFFTTNLFVFWFLLSFCSKPKPNQNSFLSALGLEGAATFFYRHPYKSQQFSGISNLSPFKLRLDTKFFWKIQITNFFKKKNTIFWDFFIRFFWRKQYNYNNQTISFLHSIPLRFGWNCDCLPNAPMVRYASSPP